MRINFPIQFTPVYKDYLWGGSRLREELNKENTPRPCAESWEISPHEDGPSLVQGGPLDGRDLPSLVAENSKEILGTTAPHAHFPLLIKLIDAKEQLSVQVHPSHQTERRCGGQAKTEMWYMLAAAKDAYIHAGLKPGVTQAGFLSSQDKVETLLNRIDLQTGQAVYIPGGTIHAIGKGCLILEVQQNSNTTYRVYDWDRKDANGASRALHIEKALQVIDWDAPTVEPLTFQPASLPGIGECEAMVSSPFFKIHKFALRDPRVLQTDGTTFFAVFVEHGQLTVSAADQSVDLRRGSSCLVPAAARDVQFHPEHAETRVLLISA